MSSGGAAPEAATVADDLLDLFTESSFYLSEVHFLAACVPPPSTSTSDAPEHAPKAYALMMVDWLQAFAAESAQQPGETRSADVLERIECGRFALRGLMPLLSLKAHQAARGFLSIFVSRITSKHPTLLIPVTPNPKPYSAPPGVESAPSPPQGLQLYVTGNPDLNFGQMALALSLHALGAKKSSGRVHESLKKAWVGLVRQYESEAEDFHENGVADVSTTSQYGQPRNRSADTVSPSTRRLYPRSRKIPLTWLLPVLRATLCRTCCQV